METQLLTLSNGTVGNPSVVTMFVVFALLYGRRMPCLPGDIRPLDIKCEALTYVNRTFPLRPWESVSVAALRGLWLGSDFGFAGAIFGMCATGLIGFVGVELINGVALCFVFVWRCVFSGTACK